MLDKQPFLLLGYNWIILVRIPDNHLQNKNLLEEIISYTVTPDTGKYSFMDRVKKPWKRLPRVVGASNLLENGLKNIF